MNLETWHLEDNYRKRRPCSSRKLSFHLSVTTVRWSVAKAVMQRAGSRVTWCSLFVLSCALLPLSGDLCSCLDVRFLARLRCHQDKEPVHPQVTIMLLFKLAAVLPKESPIDGPSPETEPIQFKAQCDAFEM